METKIIVLLIGFAILCIVTPVFSQEEKEEERRSLKRFASKCPPGLWCGKKRGLNEQESITKPLEERSSMTKFAEKCPPGLWCGKKRELNEQEQNKREKLSMSKFAKDCPPGLWCGKKREVTEDRFSSKPYEMPQTEVLQNSNLRPEAVGPSKEDIDAFPKKLKQFAVGGKLVRRFDDSCPPGLWCGKKRSAPEKLEDRFSTNCPPGLWCGK